MIRHNDRLKSPKKVVPTKPVKWKFVSEFPVSEYRCGLRAGQRVRLKHDITVLDHKGQPTGKVHREGEIGSLLRGSKEPPVVVWLPQIDGAPHTWAAARPCAPVSRCSTSARNHAKLVWGPYPITETQYAIPFTIEVINMQRRVI